MTQRYHKIVNPLRSGLLVCLAASLCAQPLAQQITSHLRANDLKADVAFLASDLLQGRATPSPGLDIAAEYLASQMRKAGLEPAGDDGYFQTATYQVVTPNSGGLELSVNGVKASSVMVVEPVITDLKDAPAIQASISDLDSITLEQAKGKVLVIDPGQAGFGAQRRIASTAAKLAPALIVILRAGAAPNNPNARPALRDASGPAPKTAILTVSDPAIREALSAPGAAISAHIPAPKIEIAKVRNVAGLLRGTDDSLLVVTGHYDHLGVRGSGEGDHIYNGANDDASGASSVVEIGGALTALGQKPKRSILFLAVFGEEIGGYGARYYTGHPLFPLSRTVADINLEQLGRTDDSEGEKLLQFNLTGFDYTNIAATMAKAGAETGIQVVKHEKNSDAFFGRSDNATFADAGIPSTTASVSYVFPDYHQPGDEWQKLDYENMAKVDSCLALGIWAIANSEKAPEWNRENPKVTRYVEARKVSEAREQ
jgi:Peptidase family M28